MLRSAHRPSLMLLATLLIALVGPSKAAAFAPGTDAFQRTWERTDRAVAEQRVTRTWMWGPQATGGVLIEPYLESPGGSRQVQYFDKSRMEISQPQVDAGSSWYVTNGLLVMELITGRLQVGDDEFEDRSAAEINVAGDGDDPTGPTYASFARLLIVSQREPAGALDRGVRRDGTTFIESALAAYGVTTSTYSETTGHWIAAPFWEFMNASGMVFEDGQWVEAPLFDSPYYATGLPVTEPYWAAVKVGGQVRDVLIQCFERRCLTYTPDNPVGFQVEAGNVGRHYYAWRYGAAPGENAIVFSIPTGPDTIDYRWGGSPPPETRDYGPQALAVAPDGTFWIGDLAGVRLVHLSRSGTILGDIDLVPHGAATVMDVDATASGVWVFFLNLDAGIWRTMKFSADGAVLGQWELNDSLRNNDALSAGIAVVDDDVVVLESQLGFGYYRIVDATGRSDATPIDGWTYDEHTYRLESAGLGASSVVVDGSSIAISAENPWTFAVEYGLLGPGPADTFFIKKYDVWDDPDSYDSGLDYNVQQYTIAGALIGQATAPLDDSYVYVTYPHAVGPDGFVYTLMTYRDRIVVLRLGFNSP